MIIMEVLFITHKHPPSIGGMQKQSYELVMGVSKIVRTHTIICRRAAGLAALATTLGLRVARLLKENPGISVIHLNDALMATLMLPLLPRIRIPVVATFHGLDIVLPWRWYQDHVLPRLRDLDGVIAVSGATAQACLARGFDPDRVFVVPNGVDPILADEEAGPATKRRLGEMVGMALEGKRLLVSVGRPVVRKGFSWFLEKVLPLLSQDAVYIIVGTRDRLVAPKKVLLRLLPQDIGLPAGLALGLGLDEPAIRAALKRPGIKGRAFFLSGLPHSAVVRILKSADLFVMPNISSPGDAEGFGLVALEAAACALPVVASGIEGITAAVIEGENGFLLPERDPAAWSTRIHELLADADALRAFGIRARDYTLRNYSWSRMCEGYLAVFAHVAGEDVSRGARRA